MVHRAQGAQILSKVKFSNELAEMKSSKVNAISQNWLCEHTCYLARAHNNFKPQQYPGGWELHFAYSLFTRGHHNGNLNKFPM